jgi:hypothetical protein
MQQLWPEMLLLIKVKEEFIRCETNKRIVKCRMNGAHPRLIAFSNREACFGDSMCNETLRAG